MLHADGHLPYGDSCGVCLPRLLIVIACVMQSMQRPQQ